MKNQLTTIVNSSLASEALTMPKGGLRTQRLPFGLARNQSQALDFTQFKVPLIDLKVRSQRKLKTFRHSTFLDFVKRKLPVPSED
jgi:hypothetical protein